MDQQINLYQPMFRRQRHLFGTRTMVKTLAMLGLALLGVYCFALLEVLGLEKEVAQLESREQAYSVQLQRLTASQNGAPRSGIDGELKLLNSQLVEREKLVQVLSSQQFGKTIGFSSKLRALAERTVNGVRLTRVAANGGGDGLLLQGESLHEELIPTYLQGLSEAPELDGLKFDRLTVSQDEEAPGRVIFEVASSAVIDSLDTRSQR
jgi:hypothetical protein